MTTPTTSRKRGSPGTARGSARAAGTSAKSRTTPKTTPKATPKTGTKAGTKTGAKAAQAAKTAKTTQRAKTARAAKAMKPSRSDGRRSFTITVPTVGSVAAGTVNAARMPFTVARRVLPAKGGLPLYLGLGVLGAAEAIEWPVAIGIGVGYAVLRRGGVMAPPSPLRQATA